MKAVINSSGHVLYFFAAEETSCQNWTQVQNQRPDMTYSKDFDAVNPIAQSAQIFLHIVI